MFNILGDQHKVGFEGIGDDVCEAVKACLDITWLNKNHPSQKWDWKGQCLRRQKCGHICQLILKTFFQTDCKMFIA